MKQPHPVRWRYNIWYFDTIVCPDTIIQGGYKRWYVVIDQANGESYLNNIPQKRRFKTLREARLFIEEYEKLEGYIEGG